MSMIHYGNVTAVYNVSSWTEGNTKKLFKKLS